MKFILSVLAAGILLCPSTVFADGSFFVSAGVGRANLSDDFDGFDIDADSTAWRLSAGWHLNDNFSFELGYQNLGRFEQSVIIEGEPAEVSLKGDGFTLGGTGSLPLNDQFALFARVGAYFWDGDADINSVTQASPDDSNLYYGGGIRYTLSEQFSLTLDASRFDLEDTDSTVATLGLSVRF